MLPVPAAECCKSKQTAATVRAWSEDGEEAADADREAISEALSASASERPPMGSSVSASQHTCAARAAAAT
jgi:hypothetical protein